MTRWAWAAAGYLRRWCAGCGRVFWTVRLVCGPLPRYCCYGCAAREA